MTSTTVVAVKHLGIGSYVVGRAYVADIGYHRSHFSWRSGRLRCERAITITFSNGDIVSWAESTKVQVQLESQ